MATEDDIIQKSPPPSAEPPPASQPPPSGPPRSSSRPPPRKSDRPSMRPGGPTSLLGRTLSGRYRIERVIGEGGMGVVYAAEHLHMRKRLAVKILHPEMSRLPEVVERFGREAMAAAHIDSPNVATATDFGQLEDGSFFLVLEYIEGQSLRDVIGRGRLEVPRAIHVTEQIAAALARAHAIGIVHRDLKPENVMLIQKDGDPDFVKVLDFGIAKVPVAELSTSDFAQNPAQPVLTQLGMVYGTPEYMAPEQALGQPVDARADLYALGVITYEMLTGFRPFDHESKVTLLGMQVTAPVPPMSKFAPDAAIAPEVEAIVRRLLAKEAGARFADARELLEGTAQVMGTPVAGPISLVSVSRRANPSRASLPGAIKPSEAVTVDPGKRLELALRRQLAVVKKQLAVVPNKTWAIVGASLGAFFFLVLFIAVLAGGSTAHSAIMADAQVAQLTETAEAGIKVIGGAPAEREIAAARQALTHGDAPGAIKLLVPIEQAYPARPEVHRLLSQAFGVEHDAKGMLDEAKLWLATDPKAVPDADLVDAVRAAALGKEDADAAFALLEGPMGAAGVDALYDLAYAQKTPTAAGARAKQALSLQDVRAHASDAALVALDLHAATSCDSKRAAIGRAKDSGDARALPLLTPLTYSQGCGFLRSRDCWPCLHRDGSLQAAIAAISARANANP